MMDRGGKIISCGNFTLRRAQARDASAIRALVHAAYVKYVARLGREPQPMIADYDAAIREHQIWLLDGEGGLLVAMLELAAEGNDTLWIENIAVSPSAQKAGIGRRLMTFAEQEARRQGFDRITLYTNELMTENIALYARLGYVETERRSVSDYHRVFMTKRLAEPRT